MVNEIKVIIYFCNLLMGMTADLTIDCRGEELILCKERALYWAAKKMLIISDLHIGKSAFFRKNGLPVPGTVGQDDMQRLSSLVNRYNPEILMITGDMFHNKFNSEAVAFLEWRQRYSDLRVVLIKGNHDQLKHTELENLGIEVHQKEMICYPFRFIHDKPKEFDEYYNISGHIHPGVVIYGRAKQQLKFPCFYFTNTCAVLPAFSLFTGLFILQPNKGEQFYAVTPDKIVALPPKN